MKNSIRKILVLSAAAIMSTICLCTAVSAEEYSAAPTAYANAEMEERAATITGTYSNGSSYIVLRNDNTCYFHIVYTNGMYVRANGTYAVHGSSFAAAFNGYIVVVSIGNMQSSSTDTLGVDGTWEGNTLKIGNTRYTKG